MSKKTETTVYTPDFLYGWQPISVLKKQFNLPGALDDVYLKRVIYKDRIVVAIWSDGTKTVAKCAPGDTYSPEAGLAIAFMKKLLGGNATYHTLRAWSPTGNVDVNKGTDTVTLHDVREREKMNG